MPSPPSPPRSPLADLRAGLEAGQLPEIALAEAAKRYALPVARLRSAAESHPDLDAKPFAVRVCRGTACGLAGAAELAKALPEVRAAYCLGWCDRAPSVLGSDGEIHVACRPDDVMQRIRAPERPPASEVRCLASEPIVTRRLLRGDFSPLAKARADGAYSALARALEGPPDAVLRVVEESGERGRGGAAFPTGKKWRLCARAAGDRRVVIANGDEGDPGAFIDRLLLEQDPHAVLEGVALCAYAVGAREALVFVRSEYPRAAERITRAIDEAQRAGLLGERIFGTHFSLDVSVLRGFGSYVCGEETALLAAAEGRRGEVSPRPPYPTERGLFGRPTVVNNVETLANVPWILERGAAAYAAIGTAGSRGTKVICLSAGFAAHGAVEVPFGMRLRDVIERAGATRCTRDALEGVLLGGPMGSFLRPEACDLALDYDAMHAAGHELGHGGLVAIPAGTRLAALAQQLLDFMADESCGRCTPCRVGSRRARGAFAERGRDGREEMSSVFALMEATSLCAFGRNTPRPVRQILAALAEGA